MSIFDDEVREILSALQTLDSRVGRYPLDTEDLDRLAHLLAGAARNMGRIATTACGALLSTTSGQNPAATKGAALRSAHAQELFIRVSLACDTAETAGGDAADILREMGRETGFTLRPKTS